MIPRQVWYQQGYRANIVTYTIALMHKLIKTKFSKRDLDLLGIWTRQMIPETVQDVLKELAELVYNKLTDPMREVDNVTQWCKREGCWSSVQDIDYTLPDEIEDCLIGKDEMRTAIREAKVDRRIEKDMDAMTKVIEIQPGQWQSVMSFATSKRMVSPDELTALKIACQLPTKVPNSVQCKKLIVVLERLYEEGFKL